MRPRAQDYKQLQQTDCAYTEDQGSGAMAHGLSTDRFPILAQPAGAFRSGVRSSVDVGAYKLHALHGATALNAGFC
jgi:hypothetical protein